MSHYHHNNEDDEDEEGIDPVDEEGETTIIKNTTQPADSPIDYSNHPQIKRILRNPEVKEVHIRFRRNKQLVYVCIVFLDGSSIERPLQDIEDEEEPICPSNIPGYEMEPRRRWRRGSGGRGGGTGTEIEPQRRSRWNFLRLKNKGQQTDIASIVENNENITVKRIVTVVRKGCGCDTGEGRGGSGRRRRRVPVEYEADYEY